MLVQPASRVFIALKNCASWRDDSCGKGCYAIGGKRKITLIIFVSLEFQCGVHVGGGGETYNVYLLSVTALNLARKPYQIA